MEHLPTGQRAWQAYDAEGKQACGTIHGPRDFLGALQAIWGDGCG
jgi:hypothetical protein